MDFNPNMMLNILFQMHAQVAQSPNSFSHIINIKNINHDKINHDK